MRHSALLVCLPLVFVFVTSCSETPPTAPPMSTSGGIGPMCQLGCTEFDPNPSAPGVFLGSGVTPEVCIEGGYTDADQDLLGDFCEKQLAFAFSPELYHAHTDDVRREPYWVARPLPDGATVRLGYLISYYRDAGAPVDYYPCQLPGAPASCNGHNGDTESIFLDVDYNFSTQHWVLKAAYYSQHSDFAEYYRAGAYPALYYPEHPGSYPRAYVSQGKHANYKGQTECNNGGTLWSDTCVGVNTATRLEWSSLWNLGSRAVHTSAQDCKASRNPSYEYYGSGRLECYWTGSRFRGWIPTSVGGPDVGGYTGPLQDLGF